MGIEASDEASALKDSFVDQVKELIKSQEAKQEEERAAAQRRVGAELHDERTKLANKKHQAVQSLRANFKNKYEFEQMKADAHLQDINTRKQQVLSQMKERYQHKIQSQLQSLRLQHDKARTQGKIDNERKLQAMRAEIKAKLESKFIQLENEIRGKSLRRIKDIATVDLARHKLNCQDELNQKQRVIQSEYDILFDKLRSANNQELAGMGDKQKVL